MNIKRTKDTYPKNTRCNVILMMFKTKTVKRQKKKEKKMNMKRRKDTYPKHQMWCDSKDVENKNKAKNVSLIRYKKCIQDNILKVDFTLEHCFRKSKNNKI